MDFAIQITVTSKVWQACIEIAQTLIFELQWQFPNHEVMSEMGMVYPQY
jgi:hypothetical protein